MTTPNAMPKKSSRIGQQIVSALLATKPVSWIHKAIDEDATVDPKKPVVVKTKREGTELRFPLARNVASPNIDRIAKALLA